MQFAVKAVLFGLKEVDVSWLLGRASEFGLMQSYDSVEDDAVAILKKMTSNSDKYN